MIRSPETVARLVDPHLPTTQRHLALREFAQANGWRPSDQLEEYPGTEEIANGHLIVEHGLDNTAAITFLKSNRAFAFLNLEEQKRILGISYNNLVDWHLFPEREGITAVFNRTDPITPRFLSIREEPDVWRAEAFDKITGKRPNPNLKSLDDALIETISIWKRSLSAELSKKVTNETISALFNSILFVRAFEDHRRARKPNFERALISSWEESKKGGRTIRGCLKSCLRKLGVMKYPPSLLDERDLVPFDSLDFDTVAQLFRDFYDNRFAPYQYDFSLMSKHALARIYEHYVSLLRPKDSKQLFFYPELPDELANRSLGGIYTPQYVARFFARFLKENLTPRVFRDLKTADPACGSGIFLRTILEMQCDPWQDIDVPQTTKRCFSKVMGIDVDGNACQASRLSLSLLHLVLTGSFPKNLRIVTAESIEYFSKHRELRESCDVVIGNPPFIKWDNMTPTMKKRVADFMKDYSHGKVDLFLALLKIALEMVKADGFVLFVLPHSFLLAKNAEKLRREIAAKFAVRFLGDLSEVPVFEDIGAYVVLVILQRRDPTLFEEPMATVVQCKDSVGHALQDALEGKRTNTQVYKVFEVDQRAFRNPEWLISPPEKRELQITATRFPSLEKFLLIQEGFVTAKDTVFIRRREDVPSDEKGAYVSYLSDREMESYRVPVTTSKVVLFPFLNGKRLEENQIRQVYPKTWKYLSHHMAALKERSSVVQGGVPWWCPHRPVPILKMLQPKIVTPHLVVMPRFSLDEKGIYAVSHSPWLIPKEPTGDIKLLRFFLAVLNSSFAYWQILTLCHKYSRGYAMLEPKSLRKISVPDPKDVHPSIMKKIQSLVETRIAKPKEATAEKELDRLISDIYGLSAKQRIELGI